MWAMLIVLLPLLLLIVWGIVYDLKRRRRHDPLTNHDVEAAARRARGESDTHGGGMPQGQGPSPGGM